MKICIKCNFEKELSEFYFRKDSGKYRNDCKDCLNLRGKNRRKENPDNLKIYLKEWRKNNPDYNSVYCKEWRVKNIGYDRNYRKNRREIDPLFKLSQSIRQTVCNSFRYSSFRKNNKTSNILGCSYEVFKLHLENLFEDWMNWDNKGLYNGELNYGWDIDHIIPLSSAKTEEDIYKLNHYSNLQPLCSKVNRDIKKDNH
jgi:hypothetical protein